MTQESPTSRVWLGEHDIEIAAGALTVRSMPSISVAPSFYQPMRVPFSF